jgi:hypothetical protein
MIKIDGILNVKSINGSRGVFSVGDLTTPVGNFKVKDQILDQFSEGSYEGEFLIAQIYPASYVHYGKVVTEVRAKLAEIFLANAEEKPLTEAPAPQEPDPIEEAASIASPPSIPVHSGAAPAETEATDGSDAASASAELFAEVVSDQDKLDYALFGAEVYSAVAKQQTVKLDPTVERAKFREQRDRLKALGYRFNASTQAWALTEVEAEVVV